MLIRDGDCELYSSRNPLKYELTENGQVAYNKDAVQFGADKGYLSKTLLRFKLGILSSKSWVGDQVVLDQKRPRMFTVVAINRVIAYEVSIKDFFTSMPQEYIKWMQWINTQKVDYISDRMQDITITQQSIMNLNTEAKSYEVT